MAHLNGGDGDQGIEVNRVDKTSNERPRAVTMVAGVSQVRVPDVNSLAEQGGGREKGGVGLEDGDLKNFPRFEWDGQNFPNTCKSADRVRQAVNPGRSGMENLTSEKEQ